MLSGSSLFVAPAHIPELTKCKNLGWMADLGWCGGWDLNPRTPTGQGPEPCAFDLSWQPPREPKKERAFDKCLSCLGAVPARESQSCFRRCQLPNYPLTSCSSGIRSSRRKSFSKK